MKASAGRSSLLLLIVARSNIIDGIGAVSMSSSANTEHALKPQTWGWTTDHRRTIQPLWAPDAIGGEAMPATGIIAPASARSSGAVSVAACTVLVAGHLRALAMVLDELVAYGEEETLEPSRTNVRATGHVVQSNSSSTVTCSRCCSSSW